MSINVITEDRASGAQVIDGSLQFNTDFNFHLTRTPGSAGNRKTWTWSGWIKKDTVGTYQPVFFGNQTGSNNTGNGFRFDNGDKIDFYQYASSSFTYRLLSNRVLRDVSGWFHIVIAFDTTQSTEADRIKIYLNGEQVTSWGTETYPNQNTDGHVNNNTAQYIGAYNFSDSVLTEKFNGHMSQVYLIDGQALDASDFGFTDPLTNTWRPKKYTGTFTGTNTFYLPMDGNLPIGKDQSGNNNDWTPVNFGGSNSIEKTTGALPILNTVNGGNGVGVGVRTDAYANDLVLALPLVGSANDVSNQINSTSTTKSPSVTGATFESDQSNFYGGGLDFDGPTDGNSAATDYVTIADSNSEFVIGTGDFTMECWVWGNDWTGPNTNKDQVFMAHDGASGGSNYVGFYIPAGVFAYYDGSAFIPSSDKPTLNDQQWYHVAVSRESGTSRVFLDGVLVGSASDTNSIATGTVELGRNPGNNKNQFNGYLQDFRLYVGTAKYTSDFIPASTNPDILPDTPSGVSGKSKLAKSFDDGSVEGGGTTSDYLQVSASGHSDFSMDGDFTVEWFMYRPTTGNTYMWTVGDSKTSTGLELYWGNSGNTLKLYTNNGGSNLSGDAIIGWSHYAVVRSGSTITVYYNGTSVGTATNSNTFSGNFTFAEYYNGGITGGLIGPITNFRYVKGTAVYTSNFTPPTEPLTAITNTKLLCFRSNSSATEAVVKPANITTNGTITLKGLNPFNTDINTVRGQETGYATLNPLAKGSDITLSDGNLSLSSSGNYGNSTSTIGVNSGKWYFEYLTRSTTLGLGITKNIRFEQAPGNYTGSYCFIIASNTPYKQTGGSASSYGAQPSVGDVIGVTFDLDSGTIETYRNGISQGEMYSNNADIKSGATFYAEVGDPTTSANIDGTVNFGQKPFKFPPPEGFQPLNTANTRPETVIARPDRYVGAITYQGITQSPRTISLPITPDFIWVKNRDDTNGHYLFDTVRGDNKNLRSDGTFTESAVSGASHGIISTIGSNSFTVKDGSSTGDNVGSTTTEDYVAWFWKAGGNKGTFNKDDVGYASASAAGLTAGDASEVTGSSVGTKQGFSIISYTSSASDDGSAQIPHGLSQTPDFVLIKNRDTATSSQGWPAWHSGIPNESRYLDSGNAWDATEFAYFFNDTAPTSTIVNVSANSAVSSGNRYRSYGGSDKFIMYAWHNVPGLQKFGIYEGNNDSNGPFVELGFNPAIIWTKSVDSDGKGWEVHWNSGPSLRQNPQSERLMLNETAAKATSNHVDFLSNGFKIRNTFSGMNNASETWLYCAWADVPTSNLYGATSNAR
jgi:hypothetical protein